MLLLSGSTREEREMESGGALTTMNGLGGYGWDRQMKGNIRPVVYWVSLHELCLDFRAINWVSN